MLADYWHRVRLIRREAWIVLAGSAALGFTWFGLMDAILNLYLVRMGCGLAFVGTSAAIGTLGYALISVPGAALARRLGGRRGMIAGTLVWGACMIALSLADLLPTAWRQPWVLVMRFLGTSGVALILVSNMPFLVEVTTSEERAHAFALSSSLSPLGAFLGLACRTMPSLFNSALFHDAAALRTSAARGERTGEVVRRLLAEQPVELLQLVAVKALEIADRLR